MGASERYLSRPWLRHYQEGVPASVEIPLRSFTRMFDEATERAPERTAVAFYGRSEDVLENLETYRFGILKGCMPFTCGGQNGTFSPSCHCTAMPAVLPTAQT